MKYDYEEVITVNGHKMRGIKGDFMTNRIKSRGLYEKLTLDFLRGYLRHITKPVILDIGANIGNHTLDFSTYAGKVYSFEPINFVYDLLQSNVAVNDIKNVITVNKALSDKEGADEIHLCDHNIGASSISLARGKGTMVEVKKITGDSFFNKENLASLDFIKIDVEGHEKYALKGLMNTIKKHKPLILMEWNEPEACRDFNSDGLLDLLMDIYEVKVIGTNRDPGYWAHKPAGKIRRKLTKIFRKKAAALYDFDKNQTYMNILFIPK